MRLPSKLRIKQSKDFDQVRKEGVSHPGRYLVLAVAQVPELVGFQFGLITTRKLGNAVVRNRIRRRLREIVRTTQECLVPGLRLVLIARWRAPEASLEELRKDWLKLLRRAQILRAEPTP